MGGLVWSDRGEERTICRGGFQEASLREKVVVVFVVVAYAVVVLELRSLCTLVPNHTFEGGYHVQICWMVEAVVVGVVHCCNLYLSLQSGHVVDVEVWEVVEVVLLPGLKGTRLMGRRAEAWVCTTCCWL